MILEAALAVTTFAQAWKASDINEKALNTLKKAHNTHADAVALFQRHKEDADKSLVKLINRKKAILSNRMPQFISVYQQIRAIDFQPGDGILELYSNNLSVRDVEEIKLMAVTAQKPMSEQELAVEYLITGVGGMFVADAKRNAAIANSQQQIANALYSQAETLVIAVDAIGKRAEQIARLLSQLSLLFGQCTEATEEIILRNGSNRVRYSKTDREVLMNCVNLASAVKAVLDVPILNADGSVTEASLVALQEGEARLQKFRIQ